MSSEILNLERTISFLATLKIFNYDNIIEYPAAVYTFRQNSITKDYSLFSIRYYDLEPLNPILDSGFKTEYQSVLGEFSRFYPNFFLVEQLVTENKPESLLEEYYIVGKNLEKILNNNKHQDLEQMIVILQEDEELYFDDGRGLKYTFKYHPKIGDKILKAKRV